MAGHRKQYREGIITKSGPVPVLDQFTAEEINQITELWKLGKTQEEIGKIVNKSRRTIMKVCKKFGLKRGQKEAQLLKPRRDPKVEQQVVELYKSGHTFHDIARLLSNVSVSQAHRIIKKFSVSKPETLIDEEEICNDYSAGDTMHEVAKTHGISTYVVKQVLEKNNISIRNPIVKGGRKSKLENIELPQFEDTKEWFEAAYKKYGMQSIAKFIGKSIGFVGHRLGKYGIDMISISDRNLQINYGQFVEAYKSLGSMNKVAKRFQCSITTVQKVLMETGENSITTSEMFSGDGNPFYGKQHPDDVKLKCREIGSYHGKLFWQKNPEYIEVVRQKQKELWDDVDKRREQSLKIAKLRQEGRCGSYKGTLDTRFGELYFESSYEAMLIEELEKDQRVVLIERDFDLIEYEYNGVVKFYNPDFRIWLENGEFFVVETKSQFYLAQSKEKVKIAAGFGCLMDKFMVVSDESRRINFDKVIERIDLLTKPVDFDFDQVELGECGESDYLPFYTAFHYLGDSVRRGFCIGGWFRSKLVSCCSFGPVVRKEIADKQDVDVSEIWELTRFCIHPDYHKKNFASWMISRAIKLLMKKKPELKLLVSFADQSHGHIGTIYKACGWVLDGQTGHSYHYARNGETMHKKTLYEKAKRDNLREREYAVQHGWVRVPEKPKSRFLWSA